MKVDFFQREHRQNVKTMHTPLKIALAAAAVSLLGINAAMADLVIQRVDHTNGPPTFIYAHNQSGPLQTIAIYDEGRSFGPTTVVTRADTSANRVKIRHGRGQNISGPVQNRETQ